MERFDAGHSITIQMTKWGERPHWRYDGVYLGVDEHGEWLEVPAGTWFSRPGAEFRGDHTSLRLVHGDGRPAVSSFYRDAGNDVHIYVDIATRPTWEDATLRAVDLDLDVVRLTDGTVFIDDEDEFAEHQIAFSYPAEVVAMVRRCRPCAHRSAGGQPTVRRLRRPLVRRPSVVHLSEPDAALALRRIAHRPDGKAGGVPTRSGENRRHRMIRKYAGALALATVVSVSAACGSGGSSDTSRSQHSSSESAAAATSSAAPSASAGTSPVSAFCAHIAPAGNGPADAFQELELFDPSAARETATQEAKLMKGAVPPAAIAKDWKVWKSFVQVAVRTLANKNADESSLDSLTKLDDSAHAAQKQLSDYAFAHCS